MSHNISFTTRIIVMIVDKQYLIDGGVLSQRSTLLPVTYVSAKTNFTNSSMSYAHSYTELYDDSMPTYTHIS